MNNKNILWGILLIVVGIIFGLNALNITNIDFFFAGWWTLFIIIPCFVGLFKEKEKIGNIIGLLFGVFLLLCAQGLVEFELLFKLAIPILLVVFGIQMIIKNTINEKIPDVKNELELAATFSYQNINLEKEEFKGCNLDAIFGGIKYDIHNSKIKDKSAIKVSAIFGGVDIIVPKEVNIIVKSTSIFGGVTNKHDNKDYKKTIYIDALCLFGGVEIHDKNSEDN